MKTIFVLMSVIVAFSSALPILENDFSMLNQWTSWKKQHGKVYSEEDEVVRYAIWKVHMQLIEQHNSQNSNFTLAMNQFGDLTNTEFRNRVGKLKGTKTPAPHMHVVTDVELPKEVDWRDSGYVTEVKDQGQCGSCWAFSTTGSVEGQNFKATGELVSLSEQNLVDCSEEQGNYGCVGGLPDYSFQYIIDNGGIDTESSYPYHADFRKCKYSKQNSGATISSFVDIHSRSEKALKHAVGTVGPISVAIDASNFSFQFYSKGVYDEKKCSQRDLDHAVLVVGYGEYHGKPYWLVKNSWGVSWGLDGYIMMSRGMKNQCGIATQASYPVV